MAREASRAEVPEGGSGWPHDTHLAKLCLAVVLVSAREHHVRVEEEVVRHDHGAHTAQCWQRGPRLHARKKPPLDERAQLAMAGGRSELERGPI